MNFQSPIFIARPTRIKFHFHFFFKFSQKNPYCKSQEKFTFQQKFLFLRWNYFNKNRKKFEICQFFRIYNYKLTFLENVAWV